MVRSYREIIIILLLLIIGWGYFHQSKPIITPSEPKWVHDTTVIRDSFPPPIKIIERDTVWSTDTLFKRLSTNDSLIIAEKIIKDLNTFYETRTYSDTLKNDSLAFIHITETISKNALESRIIKYRNNYHQTPIYLNKRSLGGYVQVGYNSARLGLVLDVNHKLNYMTDYDFIRKSFSVGVIWQIWEK